MKMKNFAWIMLCGALAVLTGVALPTDEGPTAWSDTFNDGFAFACIAALLGFSVLALMDLSRLHPRDRKPLKFGWLKALAVGYICSVGAIKHLPPPEYSCAGGPNGLQRERAYDVHQALESYARDHDGHFPPADRWIAELVSRPGPWHDGALPATLWSKQGQRVALKPALAGLPGADAPAKIEALATMSPLPGGRYAEAGGPARADDYGALLYDMDARTGTYVLYLVGKEKQRAVLAGVFTNTRERTFIGPQVTG